VREGGNTNIGVCPGAVSESVTSIGVPPPRG